eukprot:PDM60523.1 hypothetical protein PRIPAC_53501 [Pristionchus pacificus]
MWKAFASAARDQRSKINHSKARKQEYRIHRPIPAPGIPYLLAEVAEVLSLVARVVGRPHVHSHQHTLLTRRYWTDY